MFRKYVKVVSVVIVTLAFMRGMSTPAWAQQTKRPFTVADEIGLATFNEYSGPAVHFSPDGKFVAVKSERGRLDLNRPEDSLRFYNSQDIEEILIRPDVTQSLSPAWVVTRSTDKEGPIIKDWRWLADSSGVVFLERTARETQRLVLADLRTKTIEVLTPATDTVAAFDVRDRQHYVYSAVHLSEREKVKHERQASAIVGTGRSLMELLFPDDPGRLSSHSSLWAVVAGKRFEAKAAARLVPEGELALSPDGRFVVTTLPVNETPLSWETLYPPPFPSSPYRIRAGGSAREFVRINLKTGSVAALTDAPTSNDGGWLVGGTPSWSRDGEAILLPGTFLSSNDGAPSRPCVAVVDLVSKTRACVEKLEARTDPTSEADYRIVLGAGFADGDKRRIIVKFTHHQDASLGTSEYRCAGVDGAWQVGGQIKGVLEFGRKGLEVTVKQGINEPPLLVAKNEQTSRAIWDPNPQLKDIELGRASIYRWKDKEGRAWRGGLYEPSSHELGQPFPLVIQTHGFTEWEFRPSGIHPTAFAARALAAAGFVVLQVADEQICPLTTAGEGSCAVSGYEAAVKQLVSEGLVDPNKVGIIGFSRTCFYVMATLTTSSLRLKAASITDGFMVDYFQYMLMPERLSREADVMIGAPPFGEGLQQWLKRSPGFMLDKVSAPLLIVGEGPSSLLFMWDPYAALRYLRKPVDLLMLNTDEHILTNPAERMASQGGSLDWFRFWLKDEEDPDPTKAGQYTRWRELRELQKENEKVTSQPKSH